LSTCQLHILLIRTVQIYLELHFCVELHTKKPWNMQNGSGFSGHNVGSRQIGLVRSVRPIFCSKAAWSRPCNFSLDKWRYGTTLQKVGYVYTRTWLKVAYAHDVGEVLAVTTRHALVVNLNHHHHHHDAKTAEVRCDDSP